MCITFDEGTDKDRGVTPVDLLLSDAGYGRSGSAALLSDINSKLGDYHSLEPRMRPLGASSAEDQQPWHHQLIPRRTVILVSLGPSHTVLLS